MSSEPPSLPYRFGAFELSPFSGELRKHGIQVRLSPQPFQILTHLIEHAGEVVPRDDLRNRLWGQDRTSVEFDAGLNRCVRQIRAALNDDADAPRYVETVPRKGYRFIGSLEKTPAPEVPKESPPPVASRPVPIWRALATISLLVALAAVWMVSQRSKLSSDLNSVPLAVARGDQLVPTFSPDGRQVAFVWNGEHQDNFDIYLKLIGSSSAPLRLTTSEDLEYSPAWSPDGRWIAFCRGADTYGGAVMVIPALGGAERKVINLYALASPFNRSISWTRDSKSLVIADRLSVESKKGLYLVDVETGERHQITTPAPDEEDMHPAVSPDGQTMAFTRDVGRGVSSILLSPLAGVRHVRALPSPRGKNESGNFYNARPAWTPDGSHIVFASNAGGNQHMWLAPARGSAAPIELRALGGGVQDASVSGSGELAFTHETIDSNIWKIDLSALPAGGFHPVPVAVSTRLEESPSVAPDGTRIAFESNVSGYSEVWTSRADGSNPVQLTSLQNPVTGSPDWSPDGKRIIFDSRASGRPQIYIVGSDGGKPLQLSFGNASNVVPQWLPDGRSIYFASDRTGRMEIWRMPASGGVPSQITFQGGFGPMPSRDGESLYYRSGNSVAGSLWELRLSTGRRTLVSKSSVDRAYAAAPDGVYFYVGGNGGPQDSLFFFEKRSLRTTLIFQTEKRAGRGMMLAPDGHTLYYTQLDQNGHELFLVKEFWK